MNRLRPILVATIAVLSASTSAPAQSSSASRPDSAGKPVVTVVTRDRSFTDDELAARHLGRLEFALRSLERPTQPLPAGEVILRRAGGGEIRRVALEPSAVATFDSLAVGTYEFRVRRMGYVAVASTVTVKDGCRTDVEVYLRMDFIGLVEAGTPVASPRIVITTCR